MVSASNRLQKWWERIRGADPYWDGFLHRPPFDPRNVITPVILGAPSGSVFPQRTEIHDPVATSGHIKELAGFFGADATGIAGLGADGALPAAAGEGYTAAIACLVAAVEEVSEGAGIGGQFALQKSAVVNFNVAAYIRELGYRATIINEGAAAYAAAAGLGSLENDGRLNTRSFGRRFGLAGVVFTDLPLAPDAPH